MLFVWIVFGVLGAVMGSFGNVLVARMPAGKTLGGRSSCDACKKTLSPLDLIPIVSILLSRGRSRCCGTWIGFEYSLWEAISAGLFLLALRVSPTPPEAILLALSLWILLCIGRIDAQTQLIPDVLNGALILVAALLAFARGESPLLSVTLLLAVFGGQWALSRGAWIGSGDVLLAVGIGILVSHWMFALLTVLLAYVIGATYASFLLIGKKTHLKNTIAFGPFLCVAAGITCLWGDRLLQILMYR